MNMIYVLYFLLYKQIHHFYIEIIFFLEKVLNSDLKTNLSEKMISYLKDKLKDILKKQRCDYTEYEINVIVEYSISGMFQVYNKWLYNGRREPIEKLAMIISNLFFDGVRKHLKY